LVFALMNAVGTVDTQFVFEMPPDSRQNKPVPETKTIIPSFRRPVWIASRAVLSATVL
jgi:hypothetical protein